MTAARRRFKNCRTTPCLAVMLASPAPSHRAEHLPERVRAHLLEQQMQGSWPEQQVDDGSVEQAPSPAGRHSGRRAHCGCDVEAALLAELRLFNQGAPGDIRCALRACLLPTVACRLLPGTSTLGGMGGTMPHSNNAGGRSTAMCVCTAGAQASPCQACPASTTHLPMLPCYHAHLLAGCCRSGAASSPDAHAALEAAPDGDTVKGEQPLVAFTSERSAHGARPGGKAVGGTLREASFPCLEHGLAAALAAARVAMGLLCCAVLLVSRDPNLLS